MAQCLRNHVHVLVMSSLSSMTIRVMHLLPLYAAKMQLHSIFRLWYPGLKSLLVTHSPLYVQTEGGNSWLGNYNRSSVPEVSPTRHLFPIHPNKMVMQRGSIELCLKKQKPYAYMLVCHDPSGKMLVKLHCIFIIDNLCIVVIGRHPLNLSMETNLMFLILGFSEHELMFGYHPNSDKTSCLLNQRRRPLLVMKQTLKAIAFGRKREDEYSCPPMPYSMTKSFLIVPEIKPMDIPLFLLKMKICSQHLLTYHRTIIEIIGIRNPLEISMSPYL